jgi:cytoskeletal protein CcmA (bactofilin family)
MAFFRKSAPKSRELNTKESQQPRPTVSKAEPPKPKPAPKPKTSSTLISKGIRVDGNIVGSDFVQIDGVLNGDIAVANVVIGISGGVNGVIKADSVIIDGKVKGEVYAKEVEIRKTGQVTNKVYASNLIVSGIVIGDVISDNLIKIAKDGTVEANHIEGKRVIINGNVKKGRVVGEDVIEVEPEGKISTDRLESKVVVVNGKIEGKITASELLDVGRNGFVQGEITVKNIKTQEGGRVIGTMVTYQEPQPTPQPQVNPRQIESASIDNSSLGGNDEVIDTKLA